MLYNKDTYARNEICSNFEVKPYSVTAVRLKSAEPKKSTIYVARYAEDGTLIALRVIPDYLFTTDTRAITDAALKYGERHMSGTRYEAAGNTAFSGYDC